MRSLWIVLAGLIVLIAPGFAQGAPGPDYAEAGNWIVRPEHPDKAFDVFFMHPTTYGGTEDGMNASLADAALNARTDEVVEHKASVFRGSCNVFAPRYRQASGKVLSMDAEERKRYLSVGLDDMVAAFNYYLEHLNHGRPFILAGHSQGSNDLLDFLRTNPERVDKRKLVAAYLIGWTVTEADLAKMGLPLATSPGQTGAVITWNTIAEGATSPVLLPGALCVNPLNWKTGRTEQPKTLDTYANIRLADGTVVRMEHFTPARIDERGGLVIPPPAILDKLSMRMGPGVYHSYDYDFFYGNLAANVAERCQAWSRKHSCCR